MTSVIEQLGALGVFLLMVPESACIPLPSEVTLLFAGFAVHQGWISFPVAVLAATAGNLLGSLIAYRLGASHLFERVPAARRLISHSEGLLERYGIRAVFIARLVPLARTFVSLPAGARHVDLRPFILLTIAGCALWATAFVLIGLVAATAWATVDSILGRALLVLSASAERTINPLRSSPRPVGIAIETHSLASRRSLPGSSATVTPPAPKAPRDAAAITPPSPPVTVTAPARPSEAPISSAAANSSALASPGPTTAT